MDRITAIQLSLRVFGCGIVGLVPVIGFLPALYALILSSRVRRLLGADWNPARNYLRCGGVLAVLGIFGSGILVFVVGLAVISAGC